MTPLQIPLPPPVCLLCAQDQDHDDVGAETWRAERLYHESDFSAKDVLAEYRILGRHARRGAMCVAKEGETISHRRIAKVRRLLEPAPAGESIDKKG